MPNVLRRHAYPRSKRAVVMRRYGFVLAEEAARATGLSRSTMYRRLRLGHVLRARDGGAWYVHLPSLAREIGVLDQSSLAGVGDAPGPLPPGVHVYQPGRHPGDSAGAASPPDGPVMVHVDLPPDEET